jgi:hypothetical protein
VLISRCQDSDPNKNDIFGHVGYVHGLLPAIS